ncbi:glutathione S-transferase [Favolaschia claudopus]|uniref:glutathione transferase n=1 Tax=Favolaschia claudopus TaxID=2862362 RepID=A0AAW0BII3_9AGAR
MAILKLYGWPESTATWRVAIVLHEAKVPFEFVNVNILNADYKTPEYLEKQPFGQIPYIDDDGFILFESRAIGRYIAAEHPESKLIPTDPKKHALFEQAASIEFANFDFNADPLIKALARKRFLGQDSDQAPLDAKMETLEGRLDVYEKILAKQRYIAGDEITLADLFHLPRAQFIETYIKSGVMTSSSRPHVARWYDELLSRPSWKAFEGGVKGILEY